MHILIIGAAGMVGRKLAGKLSADGQLGGKPITEMTLVDVMTPEAPEGFTGKVNAKEADLSEPGEAEALVAAKPDVIFHLAAIVSGEAELDFAKGYRINLDGTRYLFDAVRIANGVDGYRPRIVFTSSIAVVGAPLPYPIPDDYHTTPLTSYGTQKAICELLLSDYSRRGFFDGICHPLADDLHSSGQAEQGGIRLLLQYPARASGRQASHFAGIRRCSPLAHVAALSRRLPHSWGNHRSGDGRPAPGTVHAGPQRDGGRTDRGTPPRGRR
jgi:hypothetical protein